MNGGDCDYWHESFGVVLEHLRRDPQARGSWGRFLAKGFEGYLARDKYVLLDQLAMTLDDRSEENGWSVALANDPGLGRLLLEVFRSDARVDGYRGSVRATRAPGRLLQLSARAEPRPAMAVVPGEIQVVVWLEGRFSIEDLFVITGARSKRLSSQRERAYTYANSAPHVDQCLEHVYPDLALPSDDAQEPHVIHHLCVPNDKLTEIGDPGTGTGGRSMDLAVLIAALAYRYRWKLGPGRVVATGMVSAGGAHDFCTVQAVDRLSDKLKAIGEWAATLPQARGEPRCVVLVPSDNYSDAAEDRDPLTAATEQLETIEGVRLRRVRSFEDVLSALPWRRSRWSGVQAVDVVVSVLGYLWYAERLLVGDYLGDPATQARYSLAKAFALSTLPVLLPASVLLGAPLFTRGSPRPMPAIASILPLLLVTSWVALLLQWALGGMDFPPTTPYLLHPEPSRRIAFLFKDIGAFYPILLSFMVVFPLQAQRSIRWADVDRAEGRILTPAWTAHRSWARHSASWAPGLVVAIMAVLLLAHLLFFREDFFWFVDHGRYVVAGHITFQIIWSVMIGTVVILQLVMAGGGWSAQRLADRR
jgi:hypothetical protein